MVKKVMVKKVTRLYSGHDGESHFEDIGIPLGDKIGDVRESKPIETTAIIFREGRGSSKSGWHNAPRRQFIILLEGEVEMEVGDGTKRRLGPGDILLAEDTAGRGHITRAANRRAVVVTLD